MVQLSHFFKLFAFPLSFLDPSMSSFRWIKIILFRGNLNKWTEVQFSNSSRYSCKSLHCNFASTGKEITVTLNSLRLLLCHCMWAGSAWILFIAYELLLFISLALLQQVLLLSSSSAVSMTLSSHSLSQGESKLRGTSSFVCKAKLTAISQIWEPSTAIWSWLGEMWMMVCPMHRIWWMAFFFDRESHTEQSQRCA